MSLGGSRDRNLILFNRALLGKWLWSYNMEKEALWRLVVGAKYERMWGGWCANAVYKSYGVGVWQNSRRRGDFFRFVRYEVGDDLGSDMMFGVEIGPERKLFRRCIILPVLRRPQW
jgi:hypothetical protein